MAKKNMVAVIGAGALGLIAMKHFKEDGFDVTGFEARPYVGGLWKDSEDSSLSVHSTTVFNTCKYRAAMSDHPFPEDEDMYPTAAGIHKYLVSYADRFDIRRHVNVNQRAKRLFRKGNSWCLEVENTQTGELTSQEFDRVCVATGSFTTPKWPKLEGLDKFEGKVLHSIDYHGPEPFTKKNVLMLGLQATAQDVTNSLSSTAKHVYLSHRTGQVFLPRYTPAGVPLDASIKLPTFLLQTWLEANLPGIYNKLVDRMVFALSNASYPDMPEEWGLKPYPSVAIARPLQADLLYPLLKSGFATPVSAVKRITGAKSVELTDGRVLDDIDVIMYCTGYHTCMPDGLIVKPDASAQPVDYDPYPGGPGSIPHLFMNMFPLSSDPDIRNSLVFLGQGAGVWPGFVQYECQAMATSQIWQQKRSLPPLAKMKTWYDEHARKREAHTKKFSEADGSTYYTNLLPITELFPWVDKVAGCGIADHFGGAMGGLFNYRAWKLWITDRDLYHLCTKGICSPIIFRLFDAGGRRPMDRETAKQMLRNTNESFDRAVRAKQEDIKKLL